MKSILTSFLLLICAIFVCSAFAQNKVVVIPLGADCPPELTVCNSTCVDTNNNPSYCGNCNTDCGIGRFCDQGVCATNPFGGPCTSHSDCLTGGCVDNLCADVKLVFVTGGTWDGDLGGLSGADEKCQTEADGALLPGIYKAWLSTSAESAGERLTHFSGLYIRVDGQTVATGWSELTSVDLVNPINITPTLQTTTALVWTGTYQSGLPDHTSNCSMWVSSDVAQSGRVGHSPNPAASSWSSQTTRNCQVQLRLYCFQQ